MRQHRAEDRHADSAADVPPELDLAGDDAQELRIDRALRRVEVQRHPDADTKTHEDEITHDLDLRRPDGDEREQVQTPGHDQGADGPQVAVPLDPHHELAGDDARGDETDHERGDQQARVRRGDPEDALVDERDVEDRAEHREAQQETDHRRHGERRILPEHERHDRVGIALLDDEEDHAHDGRDDEQAEHLGRGPVVVPSDRQRDQEWDERRGERYRTEEVDVAP